MLELKNIVKVYGSSESQVQALKDVSVQFPETGIISILGASGCGKTTLLNIIGGLDKYTSGDLIIDGTSTKEFKETDWNTYRNHNVGFVFQNYYLIPHISVLENVMLALTISGLSPSKQRERAISVLKKVGLESHMKKKPKQLSGGQAQRVAIARAIANNPKIILADEPTGALDTQNSEQVLVLLKELSKESTVIIVTHNAELAEKYSNRIIKMSDGKIISDEIIAKNEPKAEEPVLSSESISETEHSEDKTNSSVKKNKEKNKKPTMGLWAALKTSLKNLYHKKGRTILTAVAGCLGVISISIILALNAGFSTYAETYRRNSLARYPITVSKAPSSFDDINGIINNFTANGNDDFSLLDAGAILDIIDDNKSDMEKYTDEQKIYIEKLLTGLGFKIDDIFKENDTTEFKKYLDQNFKSDLATLKYEYYVTPNLYRLNTEEPKPGQITSASPYTLISPFSSHVTNDIKSFNYVLALMGLRLSESDYKNIESVLSNIKFWDSIVDNQEVLDSQYKLLAGNWPKDNADSDEFEVVIVVDAYNRITDITLYALGYIDLMDLFQSLLLSSKDVINKFTGGMLNNINLGQELQLEYDFNDFLGREFKLLLDTDYYVKNSESGLYENKAKDVAYINEIVQKAPTVKISGIVQLREGVDSGCINADIGYSQGLVNYIIDNINSSDIVKEQVEQFNIYSEAILTEQYAKYTELLKLLGSGEKTTETLTDEEKIILATQSQVSIKSVISDVAINNQTDYESVLKELGSKDKNSPEAIYFYPSSLESVKTIESFINEYNKLKKEEYDSGASEVNNSVEYTNNLESIMANINSMINTITYVLIGVTALAIIVSLFMVGIIMYISVHDRTKEIGILRSIGARKLDIMNIFNTETMLLGLLSGLIGIALSYALTPLANKILQSYLSIPHLIQPVWWHSILIVIGSIFLTGISGLFPAILASQKDPVVALRTE